MSKYKGIARNDTISKCSGTVSCDTVSIRNNSGTVSRK